MILYTFFRAGGFYPLELENDAVAKSNAVINPGTLRVVNECDKKTVWEVSVVDYLRAELGARRLQFNNERELQDSIEQILIEIQFQYMREVRIGTRNVLDFLLVKSRTALEIKIHHVPMMSILRQLKRYADRPTVDEIILVCPKPFSLPATLSGKPLHCIGIFASMI